MNQGTRPASYWPDDEPTERISLPPGWSEDRRPVRPSPEATSSAPRRSARARQAVRVTGYLTGLVQGLLIVRFLFHLIGANPAAPAAQWIDALATPLIFPFEGIFPVPRAGVYALELPVLGAIAAYTVLGFVLKRLFTLWQ